MKTPDEIKKGLEECTFRDGRECDICPFHDYEYCNCELQKNALAYIQQIEAELTEAKNDSMECIVEEEL